MSVLEKRLQEIIYTVSKWAALLKVGCIIKIALRPVSMHSLMTQLLKL